MELNTSALEEYLKPLDIFLHDPEVSEILINKPHVAYIERFGELKPHPINVDYRHLVGLADLIARHSDQRLGDTEPLLSAKLPQGHRIQILIPPAVAQGRITLAIRKQVLQDLSLDELTEHGVFTHTVPYIISGNKPDKSTSINSPMNLTRLFHQGNYIRFLREAIQQKKTILISGATSSGKTTFLNACLKEIPHHEHLITLEDVAELHPPQPLHTPLFSSKGLQGTSKVTMQDLIQASLRLRPDRIILGELRGAEAADFIHATATGHDGSLASLHASNPEVAFMRLVHMIKLNPNMNLSREDILEDLHTVVDIVVQLERKFINNSYQRIVSSIYYQEA